MSKIIDNIKCGNYEVVDNQGVSVTRHFTQCLEKELADMEAKLAEKDKEINNLKELRKFEIENKKELRENQLQEIIKLEKELAEKDKELEKVLAIYKRALELMATSYFGNKECIRFVNTGFQAESDVCLIEYFLDQAKEELEKGE